MAHNVSWNVGWPMGMRGAVAREASSSGGARAALDPISEIFICDNDSFVRQLGRYRQSIGKRFLQMYPREICRQYGVRDSVRSIDSALRRIGPEHAWLALRKGPAEVEVARKAASLSQARRPNGFALELPGGMSEWSEWGNKQIRDNLGKNPPPTAARPVGQQDVGMVEKGLAILWEGSPQDAVRCALVVQVVVLSQEAFYSSSIPQTFGGIYIGALSRQNRIRMAQSIVHESAHHELMVQNAFFDLVADERLTAKSPLRKERRPLLRVLHATFVAFRLASVLQKMLLRGLVEAKEVRDDLNCYREARRQGMESLHRSGGLTESGVALLEELAKASEKEED